MTLNNEFINPVFQRNNVFDIAATAKGCEDWCGIDIVCVGDYVDKLFGDPDDCTKYYECAPLDLVHRECSPGLAFDCLRKRCDWDYLSVCQPPCPTTQKSKFVFNIEHTRLLSRATSEPV